MKIYGSSFSPFVRKVLAFCLEAGIDHELVSIGLGSEDPGFREASPLGKMPAMEDDGYTLADSSAIVQYLEARHQPGLIPQEPRALGKTIWWDEVGDGVLFGALQPMFFNRVVAPLFLKREADEAAAVQAETRAVPALLDWLETQMPDEGGWLVGDRISLADIAVASPLVNLFHAGGTLDAHPRTAAFARRMHARPCFAASIAWEKAALARIRG